MSITDNPRQRVHHAAVAPAAAPKTITLTAGRLLAVLRIGMGLIFGWAFLDKVFGLGYATPDKGAWINGGSPTKGFLGGLDHGPFQSLFTSWAGDAWANWLFMLGLFGIGIALTLGIGMRIAATAGVIMYILMWSVVLPPENNPVLDDHILGALTMVVLAAYYAGDTWGLGKVWAATKTVKDNPVLR